MQHRKLFNTAHSSVFYGWPTDYRKQLINLAPGHGVKVITELIGLVVGWTEWHITITAMDDRLAFPWALICSVPNKDSVPALREFTLWLTRTLQNEAIQYGFTHRFDKEPRVVFYTTPGNENEIRTTYSTIHKDHPEVIVVFHILPEPNSIEYKLMKELADEFDLIRQGVLFEKAITHFKDCDIKEVLGNIHQWFSRRISRLVALEKKTCGKFSLRIGEEGKHVTNITSFTMNNVAAAVLKIIIESRTHNKEVSIEVKVSVKAVVEVSGYPSICNEFEIANIFSGFRVVSITKSLIKGTLVEFANELHAAQAAIEYNKKWIDSKHSLSVLPIHPEVVKEVKAVLSNERVSS
uniref:RRM domain-containing protein n=1 Tax=Setaria digitata TaxID=48799 RepID=A0A915PU70_9BILA